MNLILQIIKKDKIYGLPQVNKKVLGKFKDEMNGKILEEFIGLASKLYSNKVFASNNGEMKKAKGVKKNIIKNQITHNDYKICLENKITKTVKQKMIRSTKHKIFTIEQNKRGLSSFDDKKCLFDRQTDTLPWGHHKISIEREKFIQHLQNLSKKGSY